MAAIPSEGPDGLPEHAGISDAFDLGLADLTGTGPEPVKTITFRLDHPVFYVIRHVQTGAIQLMGRVVDPSVAR